ncbi:Cell division control protein 6 -like protein [Halotydeus destructor]|nr:Cell division control protein 6 -like protein [Halotydeus destructor]
MKFVSNRLEEEVAGSLYISGAPGTGKTLCVSHVLKHLEKKHSFKSVFVNCMDCRTPNAIYSKIVSGYGLLSPKTPTASLELIENKIVTPSKKRSKFTVVILDEIDKLECKNQEVLYTLFDLPRRYDSRLILIGISNTLDFTKRSLSRMLHLEFDNVVEMNFRPYSKDQVKGIIEMRLKEVTANCPLFNPSAIELCARKVAMHSGDVRKALHICRRALELAESERSLASKSNPILKSTSDDGQNENSPRKRKALNETPTEVLVSHVMKVMNEVYGSQTTKQPGKDVLPTQQQIILCSILIHSKKNNRKEVDLSKCYQIFSKICREKSIGYEIGNNSEFISMCHLLESKGFICIKPHSNRIQKIITLAIDEQDIEDMMTDRNLFKAILNDKAFC